MKVSTLIQYSLISLVVFLLPIWIFQEKLKEYLFKDFVTKMTMRDFWNDVIAESLKSNNSLLKW